MELSVWWVIPAFVIAGLIWAAYELGKIVHADAAYADGFADGEQTGFHSGYQTCLDNMMDAPPMRGDSDE